MQLAGEEKKNKSHLILEQDNFCRRRRRRILPATWTVISFAFPVGLVPTYMRTCKYVLLFSFTALIKASSWPQITF